MIISNIIYSIYFSILHASLLIHHLHTLHSAQAPAFVGAPPGAAPREEYPKVLPQNKLPDEFYYQTYYTIILVLA